MGIATSYPRSLVLILLITAVTASIASPGVLAMDKRRPSVGGQERPSSLEEYRQNMEAERRSWNDPVAQQQRDLEEIERNQRSMQEVRAKLDQTYGSNWRSKAAQHADELSAVKQQLAAEYSDSDKLWYERLHGWLTPDEKAELDRQFGDLWRLAVADAQEQRYETIYCTKNCGDSISPYGRSSILIIKERLDARYPGWRSLAAADPQRLEKMQGELRAREDGRTDWFTQLDAKLKLARDDQSKGRTDSECVDEVEQLNEQYGDLWLAATAQALDQMHARSHKGWNDVVTPAEQHYPLSEGVRLALSQPEEGTAASSDNLAAGAADSTSITTTAPPAPAPLDPAARQYERNRKQLESRLNQLDQKYGANWKQKVDADPDRIAAVSAALAQWHAEQPRTRSISWYQSLDQRVDPQTRQELDARFGNDWELAVASALQHRYKTVYCTQGCGSAHLPQQRTRVLDAKEDLERIFGSDWQQRAAGRQQKLERIASEIEDEYGRVGWIQLEVAVRTYRPGRAGTDQASRVEELDRRYGDDWRLALARSMAEREAARHDSWDEIKTLAEQQQSGSAAMATATPS